MELKTNSDGLVDLELVAEWVGRSPGALVAVDPLRAEYLVRHDLAVVPGSRGSWSLKTPPEEYIAIYGDDPDPSERVAANLALARAIVGEEG